VGRGALRRVGCANGGGAKMGHGGDGRLLLKEGAVGSRGEGGSDQRPRGCRESGGSRIALNGGRRPVAARSWWAHARSENR
jgi:hypothetical protein